ncbi:alcohol dehydrogenase catalytic domain-containing protein [Synechococcales cyanobacterium C]|uniref:Alcohol dehydrogenase catalytic domain-containing protein n=1 Tax=Petrachloros mirabilis ULC683 TaxID=2781853 RepID=A0A8K2A161_9CYAN|nr:medium chain dehydrogenase/reductase family protein [Petrachloros mirabilis]NCJ07532.1 alcohol dehydrogenase catalytic domain-containing protein [Petrachloros mirabilis ULC683]
MDHTSVTGLVITAPYKATLQDIKIPCQADWVTVNVDLCGVCTPEQRVFRGARKTYPYWGGHELCGRVAEDRSDTLSPLAPGTPVAIALMPRCGFCEACRRGLDNHCAYLNPKPRTDLPQGPRGFSDRIIVPRYQVFPMPESINLLTGALAEPVACALRSVERGAVQPGETAVVMGSGTMGLLHVILLTLRGVRVLVFDNDVTGLERACAAGADHAGPLNATLTETVSDLTQGWGAQAVFCTRGGSVAIEWAIWSAARNGRVVLYQSLLDADEVRFSANDLHYREVQLVGSIAQSADNFRAAVSILSHHAPRFDSIQRLVFPSTQGEEALGCALSPEFNRVLLAFSQDAANLATG